jgi:hypothetical protein
MQIARMRLGREEDAISLLCFWGPYKGDAQGHQDEEMEKSAFKYIRRRRRAPAKRKRE